jgi:hypothetical protein
VSVYINDSLVLTNKATSSALTSVRFVKKLAHHSLVLSKTFSFEFETHTRFARLDGYIHIDNVNFDTVVPLEYGYALAPFTNGISVIGT